MSLERREADEIPLSLEKQAENPTSFPMARESVKIGDTIGLKGRVVRMRAHGPEKSGLHRSYVNWRQTMRDDPSEAFHFEGTCWSKDRSVTRDRWPVTSQ